MLADTLRRQTGEISGVRSRITRRDYDAAIQRNNGERPASIVQSLIRAVICPRIAA